MRDLTVGSLFAGIGGFDLGFERAGMRSVWQCEIDPYALRVLEKHWPDVLRVPDIRDLRAGTVPAVDVICGGFPCQDLSYAGAGAGLAGERSGLWSEYARVVGELRPRYVVVENVSALLSRGLGRVLGDLAALGYDAEWDCIPASAVGAPHRRDRVWLVAYPGHGNEPERPRPAGRVREEREAVGSQSRCNGPVRALAHAERGGRTGWPPLVGRDDLAWHASVGGQGSSDVARSDQAQGSRGRLDIGNAWTVEPDVGGTLDGFSAWLDGSNVIRQPHELASAYAHATSRTASEALRALRSDDGAQDVQRAAGGCGGLSSPALLFAYLRELANRCDEERLASTSPEAAWNVLRSVRADDQPRRAPRRPGPGEQRPSERTDALQAVSRLLAHDAEAAWLAYRRSDACPPLNWEAGVARVAHGVPHRVDRLACLGNALVPQIAEWIGRRIVAYELERERAAA